MLVGATEKPARPTCGGKKLDRLMSRVVAEGRNRSFAKTMRAQAAREGHLSNFSRSERRR